MNKEIGEDIREKRTKIENKDPEKQFNPPPKFKKMGRIIWNYWKTSLILTKKRVARNGISGKRIK